MISVYHIVSWRRHCQDWQKVFLPQFYSCQVDAASILCCLIYYGDNVIRAVIHTNLFCFSLYSMLSYIRDMCVVCFLCGVRVECNFYLWHWLHLLHLRAHSIFCRPKVVIHCVQKKTPTHVFDYNSSVSLSIYIVFVSVERKMNTLQFTYLHSWLRHNGITLHVTKVYFIELLLNIKYIEFWI